MFGIKSLNFTIFWGFGLTLCVWDQKFEFYYFCGVWNYSNYFLGMSICVASVLGMSVLAGIF